MHTGRWSATWCASVPTIHFHLNISIRCSGSRLVSVIRGSKDQWMCAYSMSRGWVCSEGTTRGASPMTNTTDAHLSAEGTNRKRTLLRPLSLLPSAEFPYPQFFTSWVGPVPLFKAWIQPHFSLRNLSGIYCNTGASNGSCRMEVPLLVNVSW